MASIVIREVDNTSAGISAANTDIAYVPGYAINGPVNVPTLCESLEDFQATFGYKPYVFKNNQAYPSEFKSSVGTKTTPKTLMYEEGDYEKSYIYAAELLKLGLPVLFERVLPERSIDGVIISDDDMTGKLYFTAEHGMLNYDQAFGKHTEALESQTAAEGKAIVFTTDKLPMVPGSVELTYTIGEDQFVITDSTVDGNLIDSQDEIVGAVDYDLGTITIDANVIAKDTVVACNYSLNNIYTQSDGTLVYELVSGSIEKIVLVVSAKTVGSAAMNTTVNYRYEKAKFNNELDYFEFIVTPSAELYGEAPVEKIKFTNILDDIDLEIPEPIFYYKDITSQYVNFEWLQELEYMAESSAPDAINVLGDTWSDFGNNPGISSTNGSYFQPITEKNKLMCELQSNYIGAEITKGRFSYSNPPILGVSKDALMAPAKYSASATSRGNVNILYAPNDAGAPLEQSLYTGLSVDNGELGDIGQEIGLELVFTTPTYVDTLDVYATPGLLLGTTLWDGTKYPDDANIGVFVKTENTDYSNDYILDSMYKSIGILNNGNTGVIKNGVNSWNKALGYDPLVRANFIINKDDINKKFTLQIKEKVTGIRIVGLYKLALVGGIKHLFMINGIDLYSEHGTIDETSSLFINKDYLKDDEFNVSDFYTKLSNATFWDYADRLTAKGEYDFKYLTSGAYPVFEYNSNIIANNMIQCAQTRGDATAIIDHSNLKTRTCIASQSDSAYKSFVDYMRNQGNDYSVYATMFTPWYRSTCGTVGQILEMPASFAYLSAMAKMIQDKPNFLAVAGVERGSIPNFVASTQLITNAMADSYQPRNDVSFNAITNIKPYGFVIWGNRTGKNNAIAGNLTAQSFLNTRQMCSDIKKAVYTAAKTLTFEQNTDILWVNFKAKMTPLLDTMKSGNGINGYKITKVPTTEKAKIVAKVTIYPIEPVEDWDITIELSDAEVSVQ